jgi:hypothetical protein
VGRARLSEVTPLRSLPALDEDYTSSGFTSLYHGTRYLVSSGRASMSSSECYNPSVPTAAP